MLSLTCKAAIKAVLYLASHVAGTQRFGMVEVAAAIDENEHTVGKLLQKLVKADIIHSAKGPNGGFYITDAQLSQPIIRIVHAIDGEELFTSCGLGLSHCSHQHPCPIHNDYKKVRDGFEQLCRQKTIADLCKPVTEGAAFLVN